MLSGTYIEFIKPALAQMKGFRKQLLDNVRVCEPETCGLNLRGNIHEDGMARHIWRNRKETSLGQKKVVCQTNRTYSPY